MAASAGTMKSTIRRDQHPLGGGTTQTPIVQRSSLSARQRNALHQTPKDATQKYMTSVADIEEELTTSHTDNLVDEPITRSGSRQTHLVSIDYSNQQASSRQIPWKWIALGISVPILAYTLLFLIVLACLNIGNTMSYGPIHTAYVHTTIDSQPSMIQSTIVNGTVYITLFQIQPDGSTHTKMYIGPTLDPSAWNNDLGSIVTAAEVKKDQTIIIHLTGNINYFHLLFARPTYTFSLVADKQGTYKVIQP
ncbi:MAG: hypothetical protein H0V70_30340 [Ktedonobacteraceae bacterium]|jgi:hypothetical protein|nr:hypothetical protein [Ktedonobacteraceae bacterium]